MDLLQTDPSICLGFVVALEYNQLASKASNRSLSSNVSEDDDVLVLSGTK
jgi:hypothetical protein